MYSIQEKIANLEARQAKERQFLEDEISIFKLLPKDCPDCNIHVYNLYGRVASIAFKCPTYPKDDLLTFRQLPNLLDMFPALPIVKPINGYMSQIFLPEILKDQYTSSVNGWENVGFYIFELSSYDQVLTWFSQLSDASIVEINVSILGHKMINYWNANRDIKYPDWHYNISDRFISSVEVLTYAKPNHDSKNSVVVFHKDTLDPFQMFNFDGEN